MKNLLTNIAPEGTCSGDVVGGLLSWTGESLQALLFGEGEPMAGKRTGCLIRSYGRGSPNHDLLPFQEVSIMAKSKLTQKDTLGESNVSYSIFLDLYDKVTCFIENLEFLIDAAFQGKKSEKWR